MSVTSISSNDRNNYNATMPQSSEDKKDIIIECTRLRKELERKESRGDKLIKELNNLRNINNNQEKELRRITMSLNKIQQEKITETSKVLKLTNEIENINNNKSLHQQQFNTKALNNASVINDYDNKIANLNGNILLLENKIKVLTKELEIAHRTIECSNNYKKKFSSFPEGESSREAMRTLYFDIGKKQSEIHALTLSLSNSDNNNKNLENEVHDLTRSNMEMSNLLLEYKNNNEMLTSQSVEYNNKIIELNNIITMKDNNITNLTNQLTELQVSYDSVITINKENLSKKDLIISNLTNDNTILRNNKQMLLEKYKDINTIITNIESRNSNNEDRLQLEIKKLTNNNNNLQSKINIYNNIEIKYNNEMNKNKKLINNNNQLLNNIKQLQLQLQNNYNDNINNTEIINNMKAKIISLETVIEDKRSTINNIVKERDEAVKALNQTLVVIKDLTNKYNKEASDNVSNKNYISKLESMKSELHNSTIDSLHREKLKTKALEKCISLMPLLARYRDLQWASPNKNNNTVTTATSSTSNNNYNSSSVIRDLTFTTADNNNNNNDNNSIVSTSDSSVEEAVQSVTNSITSIISNHDFNFDQIKQTEIELNELEKLLNTAVYTIQQRHRGSDESASIINDNTDYQLPVLPDWLQEKMSSINNNNNNNSSDRNEIYYREQSKHELEALPTPPDSNAISNVFDSSNDATKNSSGAEAGIGKARIPRVPASDSIFTKSTTASEPDGSPATTTAAATPLTASSSNTYYNHANYGASNYDSSSKLHPTEELSDVPPPRRTSPTSLIGPETTNSNNPASSAIEGVSRKMSPPRSRSPDRGKQSKALYQIKEGAHESTQTVTELGSAGPTNDSSEPSLINELKRLRNELRKIDPNSVTLSTWGKTPDVQK